MTSKKIATTAVRAGINSDKHHGAVVAPIHLSSTYSLKGFNEKRQFDYSRTGNPTRSTFGQAIADLEQGKVGIVTSTGMSAVHLICQLLSTDDLVVIRIKPKRIELMDFKRNIIPEPFGLKPLVLEQGDGQWIVT